jgi:chemotaxis signal transduction protein
VTTEAQHRTALRLRLPSGVCSIPLHRVHHLTGYASLIGDPDFYFLGWLTFHGEPVPVFDLSQVVSDQPTPEHFSSRILILEAGSESPARYIGLLAGGVTDTIAPSDPDADAVEPLDLDSYLPMLYTMIPAP